MSGGTRWTDELFSQLQDKGDPVADAVIEQHAAARPDARPVEIVQSIARHLVLPDEHRSDAVQAYLDDSPPLPEWASEDLLQRGESFFEDNGLWIGMALFGASLPEAYSGARGARVLTLTGDMVDNLVRRVYETAQLIFDAMGTDGGIHPGEAGYNDIRRVRLMHAAVRFLVLNEPSVDPPWDRTQGLPLNQEDLLGTLMTFTQIVFDALGKMGVGYETAEAEAYLHRWCVAGHLLGIEEDLLPLSLDDAQEITALVRKRQRRPSEDGRVLGQALVNALQASVHLKILRPLPPSLIRWYVGKDVARINGIDGHESLSKVLDSSIAMMRRTRFGAPYDRALNLLLRRLSAHAGRTTLKAFDNAGRAGERGTFALPRQLRKKVRPLTHWTMRIRP